MTLRVVSTAPDAEHTSPPGYDVPRVEAWIAAHVAALAPPLRWTKLEGGHSNLTYLIEDARGRRAVIRRPPMGELLPKAHDMGYSAADTERLVPAPLRTRLAHSFIDVLADLHAVDPDAVGLSDLGKRDSYVGRQLSTWYKSWTASAGPARYDDPRAHALQRLLLEHLPEQGPARVVHGDYGLHNCLVGPGGTVAAVVDWEISTLGDPLADLAYALNPWPDPDDPIAVDPASATAPEGFPARSALARRYAERT